VVPRPAVWSPGPPPHWSTPLRAPVDRVLTTVPDDHRTLRPGFDGARPSAVLVALADGPHGAEVLLTKRSMVLRHHKGEVSFPGGRMDPGETPFETAVREAHEEVGLDPRLVARHGELDHLNTVVSRSYIVPVVARLPERVDLAPASAEVDAVWWTPLAELMRPDTYRAERWGAPPTDRVLHFFDLDEETIWGATAHMLHDLVSRVTLHLGAPAAEDASR
jgi:8-oxo-dGTP pyrophosphatase MutT (NUDIX family)